MSTVFVFILLQFCNLLKYDNIIYPVSLSILVVFANFLSDFCLFPVGVSYFIANSLQSFVTIPPYPTRRPPHEKTPPPECPGRGVFIKISADPVTEP